MVADALSELAATLVGALSPLSPPGVGDLPSFVGEAADSALGGAAISKRAPPFNAACFGPLNSGYPFFFASASVALVPKPPIERRQVSD